MSLRSSPLNVVMQWSAVGQTHGFRHSLSRSWEMLKALIPYLLSTTARLETCGIHSVRPYFTRRGYGMDYRALHRMLWRRVKPKSHQRSSKKIHIMAYIESVHPQLCQRRINKSWMKLHKHTLQLATNPTESGAAKNEYAPSHDLKTEMQTLSKAAMGLLATCALASPGDTET